ncbi:Ig domain-containing protein [uncultured Microbacterium sp.]|uniref:beta strand repeat-containing protein n=1 Tax=uncultured Microbacterium sp. TaxID=191216 RepID=UPI0025D28360|nr:Ig domain-containing protein [uncultured Microbacterium sp.]
MSSTRSIARRAAALGVSISLIALGALAASPAQAATCTVTPTTWPDLQAAFATAPATGAVICLGADITHLGDGSLNDPLISPAGSNVTFDLNGHSLIVRVGDGSQIGNGWAAIDVSSGKTLTIDATGGGTLTVYTETGAAAIGGSQGEGAGTIIINGGTINASTGYDGAGIGGGQYGTSAGSVTINGGDVTASTTNCGPGIGSGDNADASAVINVTINGGTVTATGSCGAAGIGGGSDMAGQATVTITGGAVVAKATQGAGIGGGRNGANITISGGDVTASAALNGVGTGAGAAIGTQWSGGGNPGTLTLIGTGIPTPTSGANGSALSPTPTVQPGSPGVTFVQTTQDGSATQAPSTRIVFAVAVAPRITTASLPGGTVAAPYAQTVAASGTGPITFALANGTALPAGLTLDPATGVLSGTPTTAGSFSFQGRATNIMGADTRTYALEIAAAPAITTTSIPGATAGAAYSQTITATGTGPVTFALASGSALPAGLTLDPVSGVISGTPTASGAFAFTVTATNATGTDSRTYTLTVAAAAVTPTPSATSAPAARAGSSTLAVTGIDGALAPLLAGGGALLLAVGAGSLVRAHGRRQS